MNWSDIGNIVGRAAPVVGTLLGGPAGGMVGGLIANALNVSPDPDSVNAALASDPDALLRTIGCRPPALSSPLKQPTAIAPVSWPPSNRTI
jgi:phage tail tape-measure protein